MIRKCPVLTSWFPYLLAFLLVPLLLMSCSELQEKYIKQDRLYRIALAEDLRENDTLLTSRVIIADPDPEVRAAAAMAIARIGHPHYRQTLFDNLYDTVYQAAVAKYFAAGLAGDSGFIDTLIYLARSNPIAREVAVEALGRLADSTDASRLAEFLDGYDSLTTYQAILALWRSSGWSEASKIARIGKETENNNLKYAALYALARGGRREGTQIYINNLNNPDPEMRMLAYSGLGRSLDSAYVEIIAIGLNDDDYRVAASAIYSLGRFESLGVRLIGKKLPEYKDEKLVSLSLTVLGDNGYPGAENLVEDIFKNDDRENIRAEAARSLLKLKDKRALMVMDEILPQPTAWQKTRLAEGLTAIDPSAAMARLNQYFNDSVPVVRAAALEALSQVDSASISDYITRALKDNDEVVTITAVDIAARRKIKSFIPEITGLYLEQRQEINSDLKLTIIDAWREFGADPQYDSLMMAVLEEALNDEIRLVRLRAASVLKDLYEVNRDNEIGIARTQIEKQNYRKLFRKYQANPKAILDTERGQIVIELLYDMAPKTVNNFISLAEAAFYDSTIFHRVVPNFVIQDGCPRGDGWGGPEYAVRCEYNRLSYITGMVGMALSGKDTGGSQYFITLSPQPHLDSRYTVFGQVISGMEVVQEMVRGDRINQVTIEYDKE